MSEETTTEPVTEAPVPESKFAVDERVQVRNPRSGHWVMGKVLSVEPEGYAVEYGNPVKHELVPEQRVRVPIPKKVPTPRRRPSPVRRRPDAAAQYLSSQQQAPEGEQKALDLTLKHKAQQTVEKVSAALEKLRLDRETLDNEIAALVMREANLNTFIKLWDEFDTKK